MVNRYFWAVARPDIEAATILALEKEGLLPLPVFVSYAEGADETKTHPFILEVFNGNDGPKVRAIVKFVSHFANEGQDLEPAFVGDDSPARASVRLFRELNVPVFQPLCSFSQSNAEWAANPKGLGEESSWTIAGTEFEGAIEPFYVGGTLKDSTGLKESQRTVEPERAARLAKRVANWVKLKQTPKSQRKVAFVLHNAPCSGVEATVGTATGLDATESLVRVAKALKAKGYLIESPDSGEDLMAAILDKKAFSEFRWTTAAETVAKGGALALIDGETYAKWWADFPEKIKDSLVKTWGEPPGETLNEVPPAMVYDNQIVLPGLSLGPNAVVMVQPKRGCAGSRCDGRVCRILHDPLVPPPHQYLAFYRWLMDPLGFGASVVIHLGTRGSLEALPGKSAGLSRECLPDLALFTLPNLYVFLGEATGEGLTAKRRAYAALVDHLPPLMTGVKLAGPLAELSDLLTQRTRTSSLKRRERIEATIRELAPTIGFSGSVLEGDFLDLELAILGHLNLVAGSQVETGLHIFGETPTGESMADLLVMVLRSAEESSCPFLAWLAAEMGYDLANLTAEPKNDQSFERRANLTSDQRGDQISDPRPDQTFNQRTDLNGVQRPNLNGEQRLDQTFDFRPDLTSDSSPDQTFDFRPDLISDSRPDSTELWLALNALDQAARAILTLVAVEFLAKEPDSLAVAASLEKAATKVLGQSLKDVSPIAAYSRQIVEALARAKASREILSLLSGLNGEYLIPGPSVALNRGRVDLMPTGRNFYATDPRGMPTDLATKTGTALANDACRKFRAETLRWPESLAFFWISSDLLQNDGEDLAQMLALMGLRPKKSRAGVFLGTEVIPLAELGRPRIDLTIRISGIMRDSFGPLVDQLDRAILKVAALDEPVEANYPRAHALENLKNQKADPGDPLAWRRATYRIFASAPGSSASGVYLAVMASAWRDDDDLTDIYLQHASYAYGEGVFGELAPNALKAALGQVDLSYVKLGSDADDFLSCGGFFGVQGGMALAAAKIKGQPIRHYCGDSRDPKAIKTRTLTEEIRRSAASRLLNPAWIANQKKHGYRGAQEIAKKVVGAYGWQATTKAVDPAVFDGVAKTFFLDKENKKFFEKYNPYALEEMGRRLLEAASRELWRPDLELLEALKAAYLSLEGVLEERTETYGGEIQGGAVDILTVTEVADWRAKMDEFKAKVAASLG
jgi:cobaltochelatase CobN